MGTIQVLSHYTVNGNIYTDYTGALIASERTGCEIKEIWVQK